jgi:hypothetical protein
MTRRFAAVIKLFNLYCEGKRPSFEVNWEIFLGGELPVDTRTPALRMKQPGRVANLSSPALSLSLSLCLCVSVFKIKRNTGSVPPPEIQASQ